MPGGGDVRRWPNAAGSGNPSPDSVRRSSISFKPKEPTLSSSFCRRRASNATDDRLVPTAPEEGARRAVRRQMCAQHGAMMDEEGAAEEEDINHTARLLCPFGETDVMAAGQRTEKPDAVEDEIGGGMTSAVTK